MSAVVIPIESARARGGSKLGPVAIRRTIRNSLTPRRCVGVAVFGYVLITALALGAYIVAAMTGIAATLIWRRRGHHSESKVVTFGQT